jgi:hypothetical protein
MKMVESTHLRNYQKNCSLEAHLGYPSIQDPDDAEHYGYHADLLQVSQGNETCSSLNITNLPIWCTYNNSSPNGDAAYIANLDDDWHDDEYLNGEDGEALWEETIMVYQAAGKSFNFKIVVRLFLTFLFVDHYLVCITSHSLIALLFG